MDSNLKKILRAISLDLRHTLEGKYDDHGDFHPGDLERRLNALGIWRDRPAKPLAELTHLSDADKEARKVVDAYIAFRAEAGVGQGEAVAEFVREAAYNWANRLLCLRCMEARGIIDEVILQKEVYGWRSMVHNRLGRQDPALLASPDEGLFTVLFREFELRSRELPNLFNPKAPAIVLRPSLAGLKHCIGLLSGTVQAGSNSSATDDVFAAPDALGWAYQYWNAEEKDRVFEKVRAERGAKFEGADIIPATQLYTEPYMVKFLVQNSLGALWMGMQPDSDLADDLEYYVRDADRAPLEKKPLREITFLDPACGSGHFHLEAFDLLYAMYEEEGQLQEPEDICAAILNDNLYGIDIDERAVQIAQAALWMKAREYAWDLQPEALTGFHHHLVATNIRLPQGKDHLEAFLHKHPEDRPLRTALEAVFEGLENAHELGSLLQLEEPVEKELRFLREKQEDIQKVSFQSALFAEMDRPEQQELSVGLGSYEAWKTNIFIQLRAHFEEESEAADLTRTFFGQDAGKGLALFDILARRYEVVAANPPYMGSGNMGAFIKKYVTKHYKNGKRDLYTCFILRCQELSANQIGRVGMVTQQSWMFLRSFSGMRSVDSDKRVENTQNQFQGLLLNSAIETLAHLGPNSFREISGEVVSSVMFVLRNMVPNPNHRLVAYRLVAPKSADEKSALLYAAIDNEKSILQSVVRQSAFLQIPSAALAYWIGDRFLEIFAQSRRLASIGFMGWGVSSSNNDRFLRYWWEIKHKGTRWLPHAKGGTSGRWAGLVHHLVDWDNEGVKLKEFILERYPYLGRNYEIKIRPYTFRKHGWTYSSMAGGSLTARELKPIHTTNAKSPALFLNRPVPALGAILNSRISSFLIRAIAPTLNIDEGYVGALPVPNNLDSDLDAYVKLCICFKEQLLQLNIEEPSFEELPTLPSLTHELTAAALATLEAEIESIVFENFEITEQEKQAVINETGKPAGWLPLIAGYDEHMQLYKAWSIIDDDRSEQWSVIEEKLQGALRQRERQMLSTSDRTQIKEELKKAYELGPDAKLEELNLDDDGESTESEGIDLRVSVPCETFLEELAIHIGVHPISVYWLLAEGIKQEGWRCLSEEKRIIEDRLTIVVLRLLGYRWPKQIRTGKPVAEWTDKDGVIPITGGGHGEVSLYDRVKQRIAVEIPNGNANNVEREFAEVVGEPLGDWLSRSFYEQHISQFKRRPIAWQLETATAGRGRGNPAFSCLVYYHRLDAGLLPTIRSQYIRDLRRGYETEQRTLRQLNRRSADQDARLLQLDAWLDELNAFAEKLEHVSERGFCGTAALETKLRQYAIDDGMQSLKAAWLRRLANVVADGPLPDWQARADGTEIHPELRDWMALAVENLHHHCASVGAKSPQARKLKTDPDARALAAVIGTEAAPMVKEAIILACDVWYDEVDSQVLKPQLEERKAVDDEVEELQGKLAEMADLDPERYQMEKRMKALKAKSKNIRKERRDIRKAAKELREHIEAWTYPEAAGWTEWLGTQALFDKFAAADGKKGPPRTIADFVAQESRYDPDINDGVRVNIAPLQKAGLLAADVLSDKDVDKAIADRADWRADERRWCREGKLPRPGWWINSE